MDLIVVLIVVLLVGGLGLIVFFTIATSAMNSYIKSRKTSPEQTANILDGLFDGQARVTYRVGTQPVQATTLIEGAVARGYRMETELKDQGRVMYVFTRADAGAVLPPPDPRQRVG